LRLSEPQPDFALRAAPSSVAIRSKNSGQVPVFLYRKDGFTGPVKIALADSPTGFAASPITLSGTQMVARLNVRTTLESTDKPVDLKIIGTAKIQGEEVTSEAVPAEDRTQAFFWRHMVPSSDFKVVVYSPSYQPAARRPMPEIPSLATNSISAGTNATKQSFSKQQIAGRLRQLGQLFQEGLLTDEFYGLKVAECNAAMP
jgi:arylamine N-acetyltransferase